MAGITNLFTKTPEQGAETSLFLATSPAVEASEEGLRMLRRAADLVPYRFPHLDYVCTILAGRDGKILQQCPRTNEQQREL